MNKHVARDISYSYAARSRSGRAVIRVLENATGRLNLIRRAANYQDDVASGADLWTVMVERYGLSLEVISGGLENIPSEGPVVVVSNHPYGILDGLMLGHILSLRRRGDFRILAHAVFRKAEDLDRVILPISLDETKEALTLNVETRKAALDYLAAGGAIGVFPGGTVSTSLKPFSRPMDPGWRTFTAKMIAKSGATVVPVWFEGSNSRLFQVASHLHTTLCVALLIKEFRCRTDESVRLVIGAPIPQDEIDARAKDPKAMMDFLRRQTYALSPMPLEPDHGFEFEARHRRASVDGGRNI